MDRVINVAKAEVGYLEKRSNKSLDNKTSNAGSRNYTKYGKWIGANGAYWCASFLSWIFYKAYGAEMGKKLLCGGYSAACETIRGHFRKKDQYKHNPKKGDVIFFKGSRHAGANHIGIVYKVEDKKVYTIEGNTSGASGVVDNGGGVAKKVYSVDYSKILGYGRPDYSLVAPKSPEKPKKTEEVKKVEKKPEKVISYYPKCKASYKSIISALKSVGVDDASLATRRKIGKANEIDNVGTVSGNTRMLNLLKVGKLIKP